MRTIQLLSIVLFFTFLPTLLAGQYFYVPDNDINALQYREQFDLNISTGIFYKKRMNIQLGWSPWKYVSISGAYFKHAQINQNRFSDHFHTSGESFTGSLGFYRYIKKLDKHDLIIFKPVKGLLLQGNLGYSRGKIDTNQRDFHNIRFNHQLFFIRTGISFDFKFVQLGFSTRFLKLDFLSGKIEGNFNNFQWLKTRIEKDVEDDNPYDLKESTISCRIPTRYFDLYGDYTFLRVKGNPVLEQAYYDRGHINLGFMIKLNQFVH